jgi:hypothetical protein
MPERDIYPEAVCYRHRILLHIAVAENSSKRSTWIRELLLVLYSLGKVLCPLIAPEVNSPWRFIARQFLLDVIHVKYLKVK